MNQPTLFNDLYREPLVPTPVKREARTGEGRDPNSERDHASRILELLRLRPATSLELSKIALNYRARVSELRQAGHNIEARKTKDHATGKAVYVYYLEGEE